VNDLLRILIFEFILFYGQHSLEDVQISNQNPIDDFGDVLVSSFACLHLNLAFIATVNWQQNYLKVTCHGKLN
jgi:hypothetical protein